ncbi:MAG TPA: cytochrome c maturation protein CcmE [Kofleriaceae bacterium]
MIRILVLVAMLGCTKRVELEPPINYMRVDELVTGDMTRWKDRELKVHGYVKPGSIETTTIGNNQHRTFIIHKGGKELRASAKGPVPDIFKDGMEVVVTGLLVDEGGYLIYASDIAAKCPSKYEGSGGKPPAQYQ